MNRRIYFLVLLLLACNCFDMKPFANVLNIGSGMAGFVLLFGWLLLSFAIFPRKNRHRLDTYPNIIPVIIILGSIFVSMLSVYVYMHQSLLTSLIAYRKEYFWVCIPVLLYLRPKPRELIWSLDIFSVAFVLTTLMRTYVPGLFILPEVKVEIMERVEDVSANLNFGEGLPLLTFPLFYYCQKLRSSFRSDYLVKVLLYVFSFLIIQNRSTLFIVLPVLAYTVLTIKTKRKYLVIGLGAVMLVVGLYFASGIIGTLFEETVSDLDSGDEYNRIRAYAYFLFEADTNWFTGIFGHGFISAKTTSLMQDLMEEGIYNSDVGLIGFWNQFGIIPVILFLYYPIAALFSKCMPYIMRAESVMLLGCSFTISYYAAFYTNILWFCLFYYLYVYYREYYRLVLRYRKTLS